MQIFNTMQTTIVPLKTFLFSNILDNGHLQKLFLLPFSPNQKLKNIFATENRTYTDLVGIFQK